MAVLPIVQWPDPRLSQKADPADVDALQSVIPDMFDTMYAAQDGYDYHMAWLFFVMLVVLGSYFIVNLFIAILLEAFSEELAEYVQKHATPTIAAAPAIICSS